MSSKIVPLVIAVLAVIVAGFIYMGQAKIDEEANMLPVEAQFAQGEMHEKGWGRPKNTPEMIAWYERAAAKGHTEAMYRLGNTYYEGARVEQDLSKAMKWYFEAANAGHHDAEYQLGVMYQKGEGVLADPDEAEKWFRLARQ